MKLTITHQETYSRSELLLRTFFGVIYIGIPHGFLLLFAGIWSAILAFVTFWVALLTGKFPEGIFNYQTKLMNWSMRLSASLGHLVDGYPVFWLRGTSDKVFLEIERPEKINRGLVVVRALFGIIYAGIPHGFCLFFRMIAGAFLSILAWWVVLFTGKYSEKWHAFNVGSMRWSTRLTLYLAFITDTYPPFSGAE